MFHFRLERVRAVRERKETLAKQDLAHAIALRTSSEDDLRASDAHLEHARAQQRVAASQPRMVVSATDLQGRQAFLERIEAQRVVHELELQRREADVADRGAKLASATVEHEMLKRLRDRQRGEHDRESARRERNALDEIASARFGRGHA